MRHCAPPVRFEHQFECKHRRASTGAGALVVAGVGEGWLSVDVGCERLAPTIGTWFGGPLVRGRVGATGAVLPSKIAHHPNFVSSLSNSHFPLNRGLLGRSRLRTVSAG